MEKLLVQQEIKDDAFDHISSAEASLILGLFHSYYVIQIYDSSQRLIYLKTISNSQKSVNEDNQDALADGLKKEPLLREVFQHKRLVVSSPKVTPIPNDFFAADLRQNYFQLNFGQPERESLKEDYLPFIDSYLLYSIPHEWLNALPEGFNVKTYCHIGTPWLAGLFSQFQGISKPLLAADIEDPLVRLAVLDEQGLQLFNLFRFETHNDLLYYVLYTAEQLGINPHQDAFFFSGNLFKESNRFKMLYRYIRYPRFLKKPENLSYSNKLNEIPDHFFYNMLGIPLCE